jgi:hypothetical protein
MGNWFLQELYLSGVELSLSQELLRVVTEDSLFNVLFDGRFRDSLRFFEFVRFEFLSTSRLCQVLERELKNSIFAAILRF